MLLEEEPSGLILSARAWPECSMACEPLRSRDYGWDTDLHTPGHLIPLSTLRLRGGLGLLQGAGCWERKRKVKGETAPILGS